VAAPARSSAAGSPRLGDGALQQLEALLVVGDVGGEAALVAHVARVQAWGRAARGARVVSEGVRTLCPAAPPKRRAPPLSPASPYFSLIRVLRLWYTSEPMRMASVNEDALRRRGRGEGWATSR
jgi:hypothetical protein